MTADLQNALNTAAAAIASADRDELPGLVGRLSELQAACLARLTAPAPFQSAPSDELLSVTEAARRLGMSEGYVYRHAAQFPFTRRIGRKLLFSGSGLTAFIRKGQR